MPQMPHPLGYAPAWLRYIPTNNKKTFSESVTVSLKKEIEIVANEDPTVLLCVKGLANQLINSVLIYN